MLLTKVVGIREVGHTHLGSNVVVRRARRGDDLAGKGWQASPGVQCSARCTHHEREVVTHCHDLQLGLLCK